MILVGSALKGFTIEATDGRIGSVSDFLFDDRTWKTRWMVLKQSPELLYDAPVSQQLEREVYTYFGWDPLLGPCDDYRPRLRITPARLLGLARLRLVS